MPPSGCVLRACASGDLDQVGQVEKASFPDRPYSKSDFASCLSIAGKGFIVACKEGAVIGYVIAMGQGREGMIQSIAVSPEFRVKGIGEMLLRSAINHLAGRFERAYLLVAVNNDGAIRLYHKLSFSETGIIIENYYPNGDDAIEMVREL
jgi:ribosomal-protein-alanine N-acetyltransferase